MSMATRVHASHLPWLLPPPTTVSSLPDYYFRTRRRPLALPSHIFSYHELRPDCGTLFGPCTPIAMPLNTPGNTLLLVSIIANIFAGTCGTFADQGQWCSKRGAIASLAMAAVIQGALTLYDRAYGVEPNPERRTWSARMRMILRLDVFVGVVVVSFVSVVVVTCFIIQTLGHRNFSHYAVLMTSLLMTVLVFCHLFYLTVRAVSRGTDSRHTVNPGLISPV